MTVTDVEIDRFDRFYEEKRRIIDEELDRVIDDYVEDEELQSLLRHGVASGKRIRPVLSLAVADVFGIQQSTVTRRAVLTELLHNATLIADDYADDDVARRGSPTLWRIVERLPFVGPDNLNPRTFTILAENGMLALALRLAEDPDVVNTMGKAVQNVFRGFYKEGVEPVEGWFGGGYDSYVEINRLKTGGLFGLATDIATAGSGATADARRAAWEYGESTGVLYQIADDTCDGDLPACIDCPGEELQEWYSMALRNVDEFPLSSERERWLVETAPAWCVTKMLEQEEILSNLDVALDPDVPPSNRTSDCYATVAPAEGSWPLRT